MNSLMETVTVAPRYQKAIRLDADIDQAEALEGYVSSPSTVELVASMASHVEQSGQAAFTWTGPYGGGKSSLAVVLSGLFSNDDIIRRAAERAIGEKATAKVRKAFPGSDSGWKTIGVVGSKTDPVGSIANALGLHEQGVSETKLLEVFDQQLSEQAGLLLIVDEMGKFLEAAAAGEADVHVFQQLAEMANRSKGRFVFVGVLHQAFGDYAGRVSREKRDEWSKIQGRFTDLVVNLAEEEQLEVISRAIVSETGQNDEFVTIAKSAANLAQQGRRHRSKHLVDVLGRCWPLHPVTAMLLSPISRRRFGQNQRSVFGFLNSHEPEGFRSFLRDAQLGELYEPARLWDYLQINLEASILASPDSHRWATASEALARAETLGATPSHLHLLKTIALLDLFGERVGLRATQAILELCAPKDVAAQISDLSRWSLIVFRKFKDAYAVFAGSDFDIDRALEEAYREAPALKLSKLSELSSLHPTLAKRHYHSTGAMRWFANILLSADDLKNEAPPKLPKGALGAFALVVTLDPSENDELPKLAKAASRRWGKHGPLLGVSERSSRAVEFAREMQALEYIQDTNVEHSGDAIARREVASRIAELRARAEVEIQLAFEAAEWVSAGRAPIRLAGADRSRYVSDAAESRYPDRPIIRNELLNRDKPSSNAVAAQNALLKAMILREGESRLGIEGFPAEGGLYAALLETPGLHRKCKGQWHFMSPEPKKDPANLTPLWKSTEAFLEDRSDRTVGLHEVYAFWRDGRAGLKSGLMPVLSMAFILSMRDKIAFYREGVFQPSLKDVDADVLARDAADIQLRWMDLSVEAKAMLSSMATTVRDLDGQNELLDLQPIDVARGLISIFSDLPPWTTKTLRLSKNALRVRNLFKKAHDPNKLLFDDLPRELGGVTGDNNLSDLSAGVQAALRELVDAYPNAVRRLETLLLAELNVPSESEEALADLRERALNVQRMSGDHQIDAFVGRLAAFKGAPQDMEGLISLVLSKPPSMWSDADIDKAALELADHAQQFNRLEAYARVKGRPDRRHAVALVLGFDGRPTPLAHDFEVTTQDQAQIDALAERLSKAIAEAGTHSDEVVLAALAKRLTETIKSKTQATEVAEA
ncbi:MULTISPECIES: hypothetical protein [Alphaproteobacteria]|uniref:hypothetical protein n=1 Tax=Alphaproteobacteria TaxID=28211 RepID=UPI0032990C68